MADPNILPSVQVDTGAIRNIINGADVMAPGLTSSHARLPSDLKADQFVVSKNDLFYLIIPVSSLCSVKAVKMQFQLE